MMELIHNVEVEMLSTTNQRNLWPVTNTGTWTADVRDECENTKDLFSLSHFKLSSQATNHHTSKQDKSWKQHSKMIENKTFNKNSQQSKAH